jgi:sugar O-acyltransferase (sialic acid O-acetyltransferase NeuD family)
MGKTAATQGNGVRAHSAASAPAPGVPGTLPPDIRRVLIVGAGGFGREVLQWARDAWPNRSHLIVGFLSNDSGSSAGEISGLHIVGDPSAFDIRSDDGLILGIGIPSVRRAVAEKLIASGARLLTLVHPSAIVSPTATLGPGTVVCPFAVVSDSATTGCCALLNYHASMGHDSTAGDYVVLSPSAALGGNAHIGNDVFLGMHASVGPGRRVGHRSKISANSCALTDAPEDSIVFGVPGKIAPRFSVS